MGGALSSTPKEGFKSFDYVIKLQYQTGSADERPEYKFNLCMTGLNCISAKLVAKPGLSGCVCTSTRKFYKAKLGS